MNREIKFRAWDTDNNKFIWTDFKDFTTETHEDKPQDERKGCLVLNSSYGGLGTRVIFQQYTDLKDKNNKEIYEGDIISMESAFYGWENETYYVGWGKWCYCLYKPNGDFFASADRIRFHKSEVIGNIHEHPRLLENKVINQ